MVKVTRYVADVELDHLNNVTLWPAITVINTLDIEIRTLCCRLADKKFYKSREGLALANKVFGKLEMLYALDVINTKEYDSILEKIMECIPWVESEDEDEKGA